MSVYLETCVTGASQGAITTHQAWHGKAAVLAVASYSEERGGMVHVYTGEVSSSIYSIPIIWI